MKTRCFNQKCDRYDNCDSGCKDNGQWTVDLCDNFKDREYHNDVNVLRKTLMAIKRECEDDDSIGYHKWIIEECDIALGL